MKKLFGVLLVALLLVMSTAVNAQSGSGKGGDDDDPTPTPVPDTQPTTVPTDATLAITIAEPDQDEVSTLLEQGSQSVEVGDLLRYETFDEEDAWELYEDPGQGYLRVDDGRYLIYATEEGSFLWGQDTVTYTDTIFQAVTDQISSEPNNGYGLMCRADPNNTSAGYHFWISGDGFASILLVTESAFEYLVDWQRQDLINQGQEQNEITAVCSGEYLALYINGTLALETTDDTFSEGVAGLSAVTFEDGTDVEIAYDEVRIWDASSDSSDGSDEDTSLGGLFGSEGDQDEPGDDEPPQEGGLSGLFGDDSASDPAAGGDDTDARRLAMEDALTQSGDFELGDLLRYETFDDNDAWELFEFDDGSGWLRVIDGAYRIYNSEVGILWGQETEVYGDVVIEVDAAMLSDDAINGYGLMCRADPENTLDGYHFYVSGDGFYAIAISVEGEVETLVEFQESSAINPAPEENRLGVICADDYLGFYVNGQLVEEITDSTYSTGAVGLTTVMFEDTAEVVATFDNLHVWEVTH